MEESTGRWSPSSTAPPPCSRCLFARPRRCLSAVGSVAVRECRANVLHRCLSNSRELREVRPGVYRSLRRFIVDLFDIKNRPIPEEYYDPREFIKKLFRPVPRNWSIVVGRIHLCSHRLFLPSDYDTLFSCVLANSRTYLLDCEPTAYSICYLT